MEFTSQATPVNLSTYLQCYGSTLPMTVKIVEGFCGSGCEDTLEADQIVVIYKVEKQKVLIALNQYRGEVCVPRSSKNKVQLLVSGYHDEYSTIQELFNVYQTPYFRVLEDIPSLKIYSETTLILLSGRPTRNNLVECEVIGLHDSRNVLLPFQLQGRFLPLLEAREYYLEEVLAQFQLPIDIRFVPQSQADNDTCVGLLSDLGNIRLTHETEVEMVFAASVDDQISLNVFPETLDIDVSCGFKLTAEVSQKIKKCRQSLATSERSLRRLDKIVTNSSYLKTSPVRHFDLKSLQRPSVSRIPKTKTTTEAKQRVTLENTSINRELKTKRDRVQSVSASSNSSQDEEDYENVDNGEIAITSGESKASEKATDEAPSVPPKMFLRKRSPSAFSKDVEQAQSPQTPRRPVPLPRSRVNTGKLGHQRDVHNVPASVIPQTQGPEFSDRTEKSESPPQSSSSSDDDDDTCPELPPKPRFLIHSNAHEETNVTSGERPPPLPPRKATVPSEEDLAYLVVDIFDWKAIEERALYTDPKDDGQCFRQDDTKRLGQTAICRLDDEKAYVDMERKSPGYTGKQRNREKFHQEASADSDEPGTYEDVKRPEDLGTAKEKAPRTLENYALYTEVKDEGRVLICRLYDEKPYVDMECNNTNVDDKKTYHQGDCTHPNVAWGHAREKGPEVGNKGQTNEGNPVTNFDKESKVKETTHQEREVHHDTTPIEHRKKKKPAAKKKATKDEKSTKNSRSEQSRPPIVLKPQHAARTANQRKQADIIISPRRDDDFVDFRDIEQHLNLMTKLSKAHAELADLQKQVTVKEESKQTETSTQQPPVGIASSFARVVEDTQHVGDHRRDENHNTFDSPETFCKYSQRNTQLDKKYDSVRNVQVRKASLSLSTSESNGLRKAKRDSEDCPTSPQVWGEMEQSQVCDSEDDDSDADDYEEMTEKASLSSSRPENINYQKATRDLEDCPSSPNARDEIENSHISDSDDDHDYEECCDRRYINHEPQGSLKTSDENEFAYYANVDREEKPASDNDDNGGGVSAIYYNTVEIETKGERASRYLQLENPSEEDVYVNVDVEEDDSANLKENVLGNIEGSNQQQPPPLPPKNRVF